MMAMFEISEATILDVSNFNTSNVTNMAYMFNHSNSLSLDIKNFNTVKVTNMAYMFYGTELLEIDLSNFNTSNVTNMDSMFYNSSFNSLDLSNFDTSQVTNMADMFGITKNLKTIKTPYNIQLTVNISDITSYDFTGSDGYTYAAGTFPKGNTTSITLTR
jgi:surface protein